MARRRRKPGRSEHKMISREVRKLVHEYEREGVIRTSRATYHPKTKRDAIRQALAIAYGKHRKESKGGSGSRHNSVRKPLNVVWKTYT